MAYIGMILVIALSISFMWMIFKMTKDTVVLVFTGLINMYKGINEANEKSKRITKEIKEAQEQEKETSL